MMLSVLIVCILAFGLGLFLIIYSFIQILKQIIFILIKNSLKFNSLLFSRFQINNRSSVIRNFIFNLLKLLNIFIPILTIFKLTLIICYNSRHKFLLLQKWRSLKLTSKTLIFIALYAMYMRLIKTAIEVETFACVAFKGKILNLLVLA